MIDHERKLSHIEGKMKIPDDFDQGMLCRQFEGYQEAPFSQHTSFPLNMVPKQLPPFRAEHVGSLLRPDYLLEARRQFDRKEVTQEELREIEDRAILEAINLQREVGIKGLTDGEYRLVSRLHIYIDTDFVPRRHLYVL